MSTLAEEIAEDWKDFDGLEVATLQRQTADGLDEIDLSYVDDDGETQGAALRRQVSRRDQMALGAVSLTGEEVIWELPVSIVGSGVAVREGNKIVDSDDEKWTIQKVQLATLRTRWRCLCVKQET